VAGEPRGAQWHPVGLTDRRPMGGLAGPLSLVPGISWAHSDSSRARETAFYGSQLASVPGEARGSRPDIDLSRDAIQNPPWPNPRLANRSPRATSRGWSLLAWSKSWIDEPRYSPSCKTHARSTSNGSPRCRFNSIRSSAASGKFSRTSSVLTGGSLIQQHGLDVNREASTWRIVNAGSATLLSFARLRVAGQPYRVLG